MGHFSNTLHVNTQKYLLMVKNGQKVSLSSDVVIPNQSMPYVYQTFSLTAVLMVKRYYQK